MGIVDDDRLHLRAAAGRDLLRLQALHGGRPDRGRGEVVNKQRELNRTKLDVIARSASDEAIHTCFVACGLLRFARNDGNYNGAALSAREVVSFEASDATTMTTAIKPIT